MAKRRNSNGVVIGSLILLLMAGVGAKNAGLFNRQAKQSLMEHEESPKAEVQDSVKEAMSKTEEKTPPKTGPRGPTGASTRPKSSLIEPTPEVDYKPTINDSTTSQQWYNKDSASATRK